MSDKAPPDPEPAQQDVSMGSRQTVAPWPPIISNPLAPKRVCFYKSGDPQFSGLKVVITGRTFKTFDGLLDSLSKKVPLPFGVRTITTPQGTHAVLSLEELEDGKAYLCSDQKKVKPINLEAARKRLVPWNATLMASRGRRVPQRPRDSSVVLRTPKTLTVFRNGDPSIRHTVLLQSSSSQTFKTFLARVSDVMQFPVVKLHTTDGGRVDGLAALLFCSGMVVASGQEPFRSVNYNLQKPRQSTPSSTHLEPNKLLPRTRKSNSLPKSLRNFSPSSESFFVNQINGSMSGSLFDPHSNPLGSMDTVMPDCYGDVPAENGAQVPHHNDIEKSFRINQDGSMMVEMKVRLMIKEEETIHWTTTLSRSCVASQLGAESAPRESQQSGSLDSNRSLSEDPYDVGKSGPKVRLAVLPTGVEGICEEGEDVDCVMAMEKSRIRRPPTPGSRVLKEKEPSPERTQTVSAIKVQENMVQTAGGATVEKNRLARQPSGRPMANPRSAVSTAIANHNKVQSAFQSSKSAEILQIQNNGKEITESVLHIYEQPSCLDSYFANSEVCRDCQSVSGMVHIQTASTDTTLCSSSNDNGVPHRRPSITSESPSSVFVLSDTVMPSYRIRNDLSSFTDNEACAIMDYPYEFSPQDTDCSEGLAGQSIPRGKRKSEKSKRKKNTFLLPLTPDENWAEGIDCGQRGSRHVKSSSDIAGYREAEIRAECTREGTKNGQSRQSKGKKKKKSTGDGDTVAKSLALSLNIEHSNESEKELNLIDEKSVSGAALNVSTDQTPFSKNRNSLDIQPPILVRKTLVKQRSMNTDRRGAKEMGELSESMSLPVLHSSPSAANVYVTNWLKKMQPDTESEAKVLFQIDSDSPEKSEVKSETRSIPEDCLVCEHNVSNRLTSHAPTEKRLRLGSGYESHARKSLDISKSNICIKSTVEEAKVKMHKSAKILIQSETGTPFASEPATEPKMKPFLKQLCSSIRSISHISQRRPPPCPEKSHSIPDFSSEVASTFGSPSKVLVAFLSVMSLKDNITNLNKDQSSVGGLSSSEALQMMKTLHKLTTIENTDELKDSLLDLYGSASSQLLQNWRSFQEFCSYVDNQEALGASEHASLSEASLEERSKCEGHPYGFQELMEELGIFGDLQRKVSFLVTGEMMNDFNRNKQPTKRSEEASSFVELATKEEVDDFMESVQEIEVKDFVQSVKEDEITGFAQSIVEEEVDDFIQSVKETEMNNAEESVLEGEVIDFPQSVEKKEVHKLEKSILEEEEAGFTQAVKEKEVDHFEESVLEEEDDDFAQSVREKEINDQENNFIESSSDEDTSIAHDISRDYSPSVSSDKNVEKNCSTLEEANYLEKRDCDAEELDSSAIEGMEASFMEGKACFGKNNTVSEVIGPDDRCNVSHWFMGDNSKASRELDREKVTELQVVPDFATVSRSVEIPEDLLEYVSSVLMSYSLVFSYDSKGNLRIEPDRACIGSVKSPFSANEHSQYGKKRLPSPNTSDLSDYRVDTSESERCSSWPSVELSTESDRDVSGGQPITQGFVDRYEEGNDTDFEEPEAEGYSAGSISSNSEGKTDEMGILSYPKAKGLGGEPSKCNAPHTNEDMSNGVLIDKGRWLLKENHLIRNSPPVPSGMYGNAETTSADTGQDNTSEDVPYTHLGSHHSPIAVISSSELEELAKPVAPKCTYFNMPHGSDSEPFQNELSVDSRGSVSTNADRKKKEQRVFPSDETNTVWAKQHGSLSSFVSVEVKMMDNKVHPQVRPLDHRTSEEPQSARTVSAAGRSLKEQDSLEKSNLVCGQHCPIL